MTKTVLTAHIPAHVKAAMASFLPLGRIACAGDIAGAVALLASKDADYLTGAYVCASGGSPMI